MIGSKAGKSLTRVVESNPLNNISRKTPRASPAWNFNVFLEPCRTASEALEILLGPGVKVDIKTYEITGSKLVITI
jgi:hypothetical protein